MAEGFKQEICPICLDEFREPKLLRCCKHLFCSTCLEDYIHRSSNDDENVQNFQCPLCREDVQIPAGGIRYFPSNETRGVGIKCDACDTTVARFRCRDCQQNYCDTCNKMHGKLRKHEIIKLTEQSESSNKDVLRISLGAKDVCGKHATVKAEYFCQECIIACCSDCFTRDHDHHKVLPLAEKKTKEIIKSKLQTMTEETKKHLKKAEELSASLNGKFQKANNMAETLCGKVDDQVQLLYSELKRQGDIIKDEIKKSCLLGKASDVKNDTINFKETKGTIEILAEDIKASIKCSGLVLSDEVCIVPLIERILKIDQENKNYSIKLNIRDGEVKEISFEEATINPNVLTNQIGSITIKGEPKKDSGPKVEPVNNPWLPVVPQTNPTTCYSLSTYYCSDEEDSSEEYDDSFEFSFDLNKVRRNIYHGPDFTLIGACWNIGVKRIKYQDLLEVYLKCNDDISMDVDFSIKLMNCFDENRSKIINGRHFFTQDEEVWFDLINWSNVCNPQSGFLDDDDDTFTIEVTLEEL